MVWSKINKILKTWKQKKNKSSQYLSKCSFCAGFIINEYFSVFDHLAIYFTNNKDIAKNEIHVDYSKVLTGKNKTHAAFS